MVKVNSCLNVKTIYTGIEDYYTQLKEYVELQANKWYYSSVLAKRI